MSRGIGGYMNLIAADDTMLIYSYCCYNVNNDDWRKMKKMEDGEIFIDRAALVESDIHQKMKRMPSGRKMLIKKRIPRDYSFSDMLGAGQVTIKNVLWSSFFVTLVAEKYYKLITLHFVPRTACDNH